MIVVAGTPYKTIRVSGRGTLLAFFIGAAVTRSTQ
jgi:hypothetical protein